MGPNERDTFLKRMFAMKVPKVPWLKNQVYDVLVMVRCLLWNS